MFYCKKISINKDTKIINTTLGDTKVMTNKKTIYIRLKEFDCGSMRYLLYKIRELINNDNALKCVIIVMLGEK